MADNKENYIAEMRMLTSKDDELFLSSKMDICNRLYNIILRHCVDRLGDMRADINYQKVLKLYISSSRDIKALEKASKSKKLTDTDKRSIKRHLKRQRKIKAWSSKALSKFKRQYELTEYGMQPYAKMIKNKCFYKGIPATIVQVITKNIAQAVDKHLYSGAKLHFKKYGQTDTFSGKTNKSDIVVDTGTFSTVKVMGHVIPIKPVRECDLYLQDALGGKVKYCRVVRKAIDGRYKYFLQIIMEGKCPRKLTLGKGTCGLDPGTSTVAYYNDTETQFKVLSPDVDYYQRQINAAAIEYERKRHINNPDCYNEDGTIKKGSKFKNRTKGIKKALMRLKSAYRLKSEYVKQCNNHYVNQIVETCDKVVTEPMDFRALARHSKKPAEKKEKETQIKDKRTGETKTVHKYKRKKRFGRSINKRSPGQFNSRLKEQMLKYDGEVVEVDISSYRASQYDHVTQVATKPKLSDRSKVINGHLVQRDLYSAFLLANYKNIKTIDFDKCSNTFNDFLAKQKVTINDIRDKFNSDSSYKCSTEYQNFGIRF